MEFGEMISPAEVQRDPKAGREDFIRWLEHAPASVSGEHGSKPAFHIASQAVRAGVRDFEDFATLVAGWNARCQPPWSDSELEHKFEDALAKHVETGKVEVPLGPTGKPACTTEALHKILSEDPLYAQAFRRNELAAVTLHEGEELDDDKLRAIEVEICKRYGFAHIPRVEMDASISLVAKTHGFNPITEYLNELRWDNEPRLEHVAEKILGANVVTQPIFRQYLVRWFVGAAARAYKPGCKLDTALILVGPQGMGKSSFFRELAGADYFSDTSIDLRSKDGYQQLRGVWIYEWPELEQIFGLRDAAAIKSFLSSSVDLYRPPFGRLTARYPRRCAIVGTTNEHEILRDPTGSRRFWVLSVTRVDFALLAKWRSQLWAEAVHRQQKGEQWWLTTEEEAARAASAENYGVHSALTERAGEMLMELEASRQAAGQPCEFKLQEVCVKLGREATLLTPSERAQIGNALQRAGYSSKQVGDKRSRTRMWVRCQ